MHKITTTCSALAGACLLALASPAQAQNLELSDTGELVDGIAAVVNDGVVLLSELEEQTNLIVQRLRQEGTQLPPQDVLIPQVLERLIMNQLQMQRAQRAGIRIPDSMLNRALADVAQRNGTTLSELPALLAADGVDYNAYRREMREQLTIEQLRQRDVVQRIGVTPRELDDYLERERNTAAEDNSYRISHILISASSSSSAAEITEAERKAEDVLRQLENGTEFSQLALTYSDAQTALDGGDLGWREGTSLPTVFATVVPDMQEGEVRGPIRTASGLHIVKLNEVQGNEPIMQDQVLARHILLQTDELKDDDIVRQELQDIRQRILAGDDFAAIAKAVSTDPASAVDGGELGWATAGTYVPEFEETLSELETGEISEPFKSPFGWHIVQLLDRRVHDATEDVQEQQAMMAIRDSKIAEETELWLRQMRDEAFVEYRL